MVGRGGVFLRRGNGIGKVLGLVVFLLGIFFKGRGGRGSSFSFIFFFFWKRMGEVGWLVAG